ncbi:MAG: Mth938-like domain-containing protein, partial [Fidelibacterota bacterium]
EGLGTLKDAKLYPGGGRQWDWKETGTGHQPGIQPADVDELLENGARVIVLSRGVYGRLKVTPQTTQMLADRGITVYVERTNKAIRRYNELCETEPVGGLFHSTC